MPEYVVQVAIENRPGLSDPEGDTILRELVRKGPYGHVSSVRTARLLRFTVSGATRRAAEEAVAAMCDDLRLYNPLVSRAEVAAGAARRAAGRAPRKAAGAARGAPRRAAKAPGRAARGPARRQPRNK